MTDEGENQEVMIAEGDEFDGRRKTLSDALALLTPRERRVFERRRLTDEPVPLRELAREFAASRERVRQLEVGAFKKMQRVVKARVASEEALDRR